MMINNDDDDHDNYHHDYDDECYDLSRSTLSMSVLVPQLQPA